MSTTSSHPTSRISRPNSVAPPNGEESRVISPSNTIGTNTGAVAAPPNNAGADVNPNNATVHPNIANALPSTNTHAAVPPPNNAGAVALPMNNADAPDVPLNDAGTAAVPLNDAGTADVLPNNDNAFPSIFICPIVVVLPVCAVVFLGSPQAFEYSAMIRFIVIRWTLQAVRNVIHPITR